MLDSGASISLIREETAKRLLGEHPVSATSTQVASATGDPIKVIGCATFPVQVGSINVDHSLVVVQFLITPVILGIDFMQEHGLILDFTSSPVCVTQQANHNNILSVNDRQALHAARKTKDHVCGVQETLDLSEEALDDCAIPLFGTTTTYDLPACNQEQFSAVLQEHRDLFRESPGQTTMAEHFIPTSGTPIKVPPRRIPANYQAEVESQLQKMGIIEESSSPWMAPMVFVPKTSGELRLCVDYRELNKQSVKDAYPLHQGLMRPRTT